MTMTLATTYTTTRKGDTMNAHDLRVLDHPSTHERDDSEDYLCEDCGELFGDEEQATLRYGCPDCPVCGSEDTSCTRRDPDDDDLYY